MRETFRIVWPLALAMAAGAANHVCDRLFLAHSSDASLAASLPAMMVATMFVVFFSTTIGYSAVFVSQFHGGGRGRDAVRSFAQGLWLWLMALPLLVAVVPACWFVVDLAGHPEAVRLAERSYLTVYAPGGIFTVLNVILGGVITGQGRTLYVSFATIAGCLTNLALDPLFIFGAGPIPALGLTGAAVAFVCAGAVTTALLAGAVLRDRLVRDGWRTGAFAFDRALSLEILRYGSPVGLSAFIASVAFTAFTLVVGNLDELSSAASNTVFAVNNVFYLALCATAEGVRIPLVFAVAKWHPTVFALWMTMPVALGLMALLFLVRWRRGGWRGVDLVS